ncbi:MAG: ABC transporter ATP-binding protein [Dehalococcoidia bacterium]|nr:ABC transporter ATP-binding protein [Dehalococcoidia bacterium]
MTAAIECVELTRRYGDHTALDRLNLSVREGEMLGFLGPNGAGKSTTIRLLLDLIRPTSGHARVLGHDCQRESEQVRRLIGYLPGDLRLWGNMTGQGTADFFAGVGHRAADPAWTRELAGRLELDLGKRVSAYSKGNRQKLGILVALLHRPRVLLLDEPTSGLDPLVQRVAWDLLRDEVRRGTTVFFSSHVLSEVEQVCERVAVLREGRLVAVEEIARMKARAVRHVEVTFAGAAPEPGAIAAPNARELRREPRTIEFEVSGDFDAFLKALAHHTVADLRTEQPSLDEILLRYYEEVAA